MSKQNKPKSQAAVAPPAITSHLPLPEALALATVDEMAADAVAYAQSVVDDAKLEADLRVGGSFDAFEPDGPPAYLPTSERVGGSADRVEVEDVGAQDLRSAFVANAQEECTGYPAPPQVEVAKRAPTFLTIDPAQLVALGWSENSATKIALGLRKNQEAYARLEGHGSYVPAPRLTGLRPSGSTVPSLTGQGQGTGAAAKPSGAAVNVGPPSGVTANGQIYTAAARGNAISIYDESTRKVNGERFAYSDAGWSDFNGWLQAKRAAGARVQLKFFSDAQKERLASLAAPSAPTDATIPPAEA